MVGGNASVGEHSRLVFDNVAVRRAILDALGVKPKSGSQQVSPKSGSKLIVESPDPTPNPNPDHDLKLKPTLDTDAHAMSHNDGAQGSSPKKAVMGNEEHHHGTSCEVHERVTVGIGEGRRS